MTAHELSYYRYLLAEIKQLHTRNQAQSVMLDSWNSAGHAIMRPEHPGDWRTGVEAMTQDPTFRSSVEANMEPFFTRIERGLTDVAVLEGLLRK